MEDLEESCLMVIRNIKTLWFEKHTKNLQAMVNGNLQKPLPVKIMQKDDFNCEGKPTYLVNRKNVWFFY